MSPIVVTAAAASGGGGFKELAYAHITTSVSGPGTIVTTGNVLLGGTEKLMVNVFCPQVDWDMTSGLVSNDLTIDGTVQGHIFFQFANGLTDWRTGIYASKRVTGLAAGNHVFAWTAPDNHGTYQAQDGIAFDIVPTFIQVVQVG